MLTGHRAGCCRWHSVQRLPGSRQFCFMSFSPPNLQPRRPGNESSLVFVSWSWEVFDPRLLGPFPPRSGPQTGWQGGVGCTHPAEVAPRHSFLQPGHSLAPLSPSSHSHSHGPLRRGGRGRVRKRKEVARFTEHLLLPALLGPPPRSARAPAQTGGAGSAGGGVRGGGAARRRRVRLSPSPRAARRRGPGTRAGRRRPAPGTGKARLCGGFRPARSGPSPPFRGREAGRASQ